MGKDTKRFVRILFGVIVLLVGVVGLFLPVLQDVVIIVLGLHLICPSKAAMILKRGRSLFYEKFGKKKGD